MCKTNLLSEMVTDMKHGVYDFTKDGKCISCGQCCSNLIPISAKEIKNIKRYIKKKHIKEQKHNYPISNEIIDMTCPFRSEKEQKCLIYEIRPEICRDFQCNKPREQVEMSKKLLHKRYEICDMRQTFYGEEGWHEQIFDRV
ncbi:MAG: YkgJ family cysteine cluster protein [Lachnospiraceae bacterium]|nr:YkgJ family cysteine cluster protein [Lachnospiraceae bacterium]